MSGTALDHPLVRGYLRDLDAAMRGLPAAQARELREQITAHLDDALGPGASEQDVAATLSRLGSPDDLATEAGAASGSSGPQAALGRGRVRWWLAVVIAIPVITAAVLGALQISSAASRYAASARDQHLARLGAAVVTLTRDMEDERDLSPAYAARGQAGRVPLALARARAATDAAAVAVRADAAGIGAGYQPGTDRDLYAALSARPSVLAGEDLRSLQQADDQATTDLADFNAATNTAEQEFYSTTVSGAVVDIASSNEILAEQKASARPSQPLTGITGLTGPTWYRDMSTTIGDTRKVTGQLTSQVTARADTLKSSAARSLLLISSAAGVLILLLLAGIRGARVPVR